MIESFSTDLSGALFQRVAGFWFFCDVSTIVSNQVRPPILLNNQHPNGDRIMKKTCPIVIVTEEYDMDADLMLVQLREMGHDAVRVHPANIPSKTGLSFAYDGVSWENTLLTPEQEIRLDEVRSIWWRRPDRPQVPDTLTKEERLFAGAELVAATAGMWSALEHSCYWVSFPSNIRRATPKIGQLERATALGLQIPRTLVSNDPDRVRAFYETCDRQMIYKTLSIPVPHLIETGTSMAAQWKRDPAKPMQVIYTTFIREQDLALLDTIRLAPGIFQECVSKRVELRVTVIGNDVFAAELHSQVHEETRVDLRHYSVDTPTYEHRLPLEIAEKLLALTRAYGLNLSTSDFIVTPEGRYVFLEMNPNGQWLWVQERVPSLRMKEALAACLIRGSNG